MNGWLHSPATLPQTPTEKEAVTASDDLRCCGEDRNLLLLPTVEAQVLTHAAYSPVTNLTELFHFPFM